MRTQTSHLSVAVLGTGLMGAPMAVTLLNNGFNVRVWNRTSDRAAPLAACGATVLSSAAEAVAESDIVILMLENGAAVGEVANRLIGHLQPSTIVIDMSSTSHAEALALHSLMASHGIACLDAPVSGGVAGARAGTLAIMAGGARENFDRATALFNALGRATLVGPPGAGQIAKLCNQLIVGATLNIVAEALLLAQAAGADPAAVRQALRGGFAESRILEVHGQRMLDRDFRPGGQVRSQRKDLDNVALAAAAAGLHLPLAEMVRAHFQALPENADRADQSAVLLAVEQSNPGRRLGTAPDQLS